MFFDKIFSKSQKTLNFYRQKPVYALRIDSKTTRIVDAVAKKLSVEKFGEYQNIDPVEFYAQINRPLDNNELTTFLNSLLPVIVFSGSFEKLARYRFLFSLTSAMGYPNFAWKDGDIFICLLKEKSLAMAEIEAFSKVFRNYFGVDLIVEKVAQDIFDSAMQKRFQEAKHYYAEEHGEWTERFINNLSDKVSKDSFFHFLTQRITADFLRDNKVCYPIAPPPSTAAWRKMRHNIKFDFPKLGGCPDPHLLKFFHLHTFIYEQYAIPGIVEARTGDVVIDAGAFIGDTACYFSRKIGKAGKVYAFEASPESIHFGKINMERNGCDNVEFVPFALSDCKKDLVLTAIPFVPSANWLTAAPTSSAEQNPQAVIPATSLDEYCQEHSIRFDFLKSDIEGYEMDMLRGAKNIIARDAPVLAISLYHRQEDYWQIPQYLGELCNDYKFWFRCEAEPVLFAQRG